MLHGQREDQLQQVFTNAVVVSVLGIGSKHTQMQSFLPACQDILRPLGQKPRGRVLHIKTATYAIIRAIVRSCITLMLDRFMLGYQSLQYQDVKRGYDRSWF